MPGRVPAVHRRRQVRREVEGGVHEREVRERLREVPEQPPAPAGRTPRTAGRGRCRGRPAARRARAPRRGGRAARSSRTARTSTAGTRLRRAAARRRRVARACGSGARIRPGAALARPPRSFRGSARSVAGRKPTSGNSRRLASSSFEPYDCVKEPSSASNPRSQTSCMDLVRAPRASGRPGPRSPCSSTVRTARSNATHAITFEWTKWRRPPRISQMPSSGSRHALSEMVEQPRWIAHACGSTGSPCCARLVESVDHLAIDVELELLARRVADPHRLRALVARRARAARTRVRRRSPATPYMIWTSAGSPATARSSQRRHWPASSAWLPWSRASSVSVASRSQQ